MASLRSISAPLDDLPALRALDRSDFLGSTASAGEQIRTCVESVNRQRLAVLGTRKTPRAILITGMGGSGFSGQVVAVLAGAMSPIPVVAHRGYLLPSWVGPQDVVIAVSASGHTEETIAAAAGGRGRGSFLICLAPSDSPLAAQAQKSREGLHLEINTLGRMPRASLWTLLSPILLAVSQLRALDVEDEALWGAKRAADAMMERCLPEVPFAENPGKQLGAVFATTSPVLWGVGSLGPVFAYRAMCQLAENAKIFAVHGEMPEAQHNQVSVFGGPFAGRNVRGARRPHLVLLEDVTLADRMVQRLEVTRDLAAATGMALTELQTEGDTPLQRFAHLTALIDYASVYAGLALGLDPTPIPSIDAVKAHLSRPQ